MNWKWIVLASAVAILLWLFSAQWWYDMHEQIIIPDIILDEIIVTPIDSH